MTQKKFFQKYLTMNILIIVVWLMVGCTPSTSSVNQVDATQAPTKISVTVARATKTLVPSTMTPSPTVTQTSQPTLIVPSSTPVPVTPTSILSITPTAEPVATLTIAERNATLQELMVTNGNCELPCWWGIELGSRLEDIEQRLAGQGMPWLGDGFSYEVESDQMRVFSLGYFDETLENPTYTLNVDTELHELNNSLAHMYIRVQRPVSELGKQEFVRDWEQYYLDSFLQQHGKPSEVYIHVITFADFMEIPDFFLTLLYEEKGFAITYHLEAIWLDVDNDIAELCLGMENLKRIRFALFNIDGFDVWGYRFYPYDKGYEQYTWEKQIGTNVDTFYETYQHAENLGCVTIQ